MSRALVALAASFSVLLASSAYAQIEIDGLNHYLCHKAKDSKFHPDKFPADGDRDPASVIAVEMRDPFAADLFDDVGQLYDFKKYKGYCAPATKEKIPLGGTTGDGSQFPRTEAALHLVDIQVKQSKKNAAGETNPAGTFEKTPKGLARRVTTQFYDEVVELKGAGLALIGADADDLGPAVKCSSDPDCTAIAPGLVCDAATKSCLPADPLAGLPGTARSGPNYLCYKAKQTVKQPPVLVLASSVTTDGVTDPDEPLLFSISKMTRLCLAANKAAENAGAEDGLDHLACFKAKAATRYSDAAKTKFGSATGAFEDGKPPKYSKGSTSVQTFNFGPRVLELKGPGEFCAPAFVSQVEQSDGIPECGDGNVYATPGSLFEECDDGDLVSGDGCSDQCVTEFCGDGTQQVGLLEECDDGNTDSEDGCSSTCIIEFCGDNIVQPGLGEACDDGNSDDGDGCSNACEIEFCGDDITQPLLGEACDGTDDSACPGMCTVSCSCPVGGPPGGFRLDNLAIVDPPIFLSGALELNDLLNQLINDSVGNDSEPDGLYDLSLLFLLRPPGGTGTLDFGPADCSFPSPTTCDSQTPGDPLAEFNSTPFSSLFSGTCLAHDPAVVGANNDGTPIGTAQPLVINAPTAGADGCAVVPATSFTLDVLGLTLPLEDVEVAATYNGTPALGLVDGLLRGFLSEVVASQIILPADLPLVGGQPLTNLLRVSERDVNAGIPGWWFHLNFTAEVAAWTGP